MRIFDDFIDDVDYGRYGYNYGLSTGIPKLDKAINKVQRAGYYLLGGETGTGKTALADQIFVLAPYANFLRNQMNARTEPDKPIIKLRVFYYSMEIAAKKKIAKWVCNLMYQRHGLIISINEVYSKQSTLSEEKYQQIKMARDYIEGMMEYVHIFDSPINPYGMYKEVSEYMKKNGVISTYTKEIKGQTLEFSKYTPNDPFEIVILIADHIGLIRKEKELLTKKDVIDKDSENSISLRNFFGVTKVAISQFNRDLADMDRRRFTELSPQLQDFKNTGNVSEDAETVLTLFNPLRYNLTEYGGMAIPMLGSRFRSLSILKNRDGEDMLKLNLNFMGEAGHFRDFPDPWFQHNYKEAREYTKFT